MADFRSIQSRGQAAFAAIERLLADYVRFVNRGDPRPGRAPDPEIMRQLDQAAYQQNAGMSRLRSAGPLQTLGYSRGVRLYKRDTRAQDDIDQALRAWDIASPEFTRMSEYLASGIPAMQSELLGDRAQMPIMSIRSMRR